MFCMNSSASLAETFSGNEIQRAVLKAVIKNVRSQFATGVYLLACVCSAHAGSGEVVCAYTGGTRVYLAQGGDNARQLQ